MKGRRSNADVQGKVLENIKGKNPGDFARVIIAYGIVEGNSGQTAFLQRAERVVLRFRIISLREAVPFNVGNVGR